MNYLPRAGLNGDPPNLSLLISKDYRCEPQMPGSLFFDDSFFSLLKTKKANNLNFSIFLSVVLGF
jgi:hypothetical protein